MEKAVKIDVAAVERELARIQRELTNSEVRTSLFNLVVMSPDVERTMVDEALNYLLGKRAARLIHVVSRNDQPSSLDVSARCFVDREQRGVCFQEIIITNGTDGAGGAPGSWIPLLVRDIPTYVLWLDALSDKETLFYHVQSQADKIIVDSEHCVDLGDDPDRVLAELRTVALEEAVPVADFSWRRLRPYRKLTAVAFEGDNAARLADITDVTVEGLGPMAGRLYGLWLAERLGWRQIAAGSFHDTQERRIGFRQSAGEPGCGVAIRIGLTGGQSVEVRAGRDGCADVESPEGTIERVVTVASNGEILLEEVDAVYADDLYRDALGRFDPASRADAR